MGRLPRLFVSISIILILSVLGAACAGGIAQPGQAATDDSGYNPPDQEPTQDPGYNPPVETNLPLVTAVQDTPAVTQEPSQSAPGLVTQESTNPSPGLVTSSETATPTETQSDTIRRRTTTPPPEGTVLLRLASWSAEPETTSLQDLLDQVNAQAIGYQIVLETWPAGYPELLDQSLAERTGPDLFWLDAEQVPYLADLGRLLDLTGYLQADTANPAADVQDYLPEAIQVGLYRQRFYALPWNVQPIVLFYNQALFDKAGLEYPDESWDWNRFLKAAASMTVDFELDGKNDQWGFVMDGFPPVDLFVWQAGGELISDDLRSSPIDSEACIKALEYYSALMYDDIHTPDRNVLLEAGSLELIQAGKIGMFMGYVSDQFQLPDGMQVGMAPVPAGPATRDTFAKVYTTAVSSTTADPHLAYQALIALTEALQTWKAAPPRISLATAAQISQADPEKAYAAETILAVLQNIRTKNAIPRQAEWNAIFQEEVIEKAFRNLSGLENLARKERPDLEELLPEN